ncbi:MAG: ATP-binding protein [Neisseriaceae bacterium]|nr:ATP-binding protein [Neisseriaceae bacterium]
MILRERYLSKIRPFYESDLIKVITGIRRCGKSVIKDQIAQELQNQGKFVLSLDFEKRAVSSQITNADELIAYIEQHKHPQQKTFVFLDEIQNVQNWNIACRSLRLDNLSLFITGSNSKLLSGEFTQELSGRFVSFNIRPFVYKELMQYAKQLSKKRTINDYLIWGGFPKTVEFDGEESIQAYLDDLDGQIIFNDIILRYNIRKNELFRRMVSYILISNARIFSANSILKYLKGQGLTASINTVMKYLHYLEEAYIIRTIVYYSTKTKRELSFFVKIYNEDVAFNTIRQIGRKYDITHNLENIVFNELVYMGYTLSVYRKDNQEIDFLCEKNGKEYWVQVAYSIVDEQTYNREFSLFNELDQSKKKIIISNDDMDFSTSTVTHIPLNKFLLMNDLEDM